MTNTITLTETKSGFENLPSNYEIGDHYDSADGRTVPAVVYELPPGFRVAESDMAGLQVYDAAGAHHAIVQHSSGRPQLVGAGREMPVLKPVA